MERIVYRKDSNTRSSILYYLNLIKKKIKNNFIPTVAYESILQSGRCPDSQFNYILLYTKLTLKIYISAYSFFSSFRTYFLYKIFYNKRGKIFLILHLCPRYFHLLHFRFTISLFGAVDCSWCWVYKK